MHHLIQISAGVTPYLWARAERVVSRDEEEDDSSEVVVEEEPRLTMAARVP
jgi:hypothetical protein